MTKKRRSKRYVRFRFREKRIRVLLDRVLIFRFVQKLHGRFWGITGILCMCFGFWICFLIRPDLLDISTPLSEFGNDVKTAPYFAASVFVGAYGLWRWRNYLLRTAKNRAFMLTLITLTIVGLYMVALMPISWEPLPARIHIFGVSLAGVSMLATVMLDSLLSKARRTPDRAIWQFARFLSVVCIAIGGWITYGSSAAVGKYELSLLGEIMMIAGYAIWVIIKTYKGDESLTVLAAALRKFVYIR